MLQYLLTAGQSLLGAYTHYKQGQHAEEAGEYNAQIAENNAIAAEAEAAP